MTKICGFRFTRLRRTLKNRQNLKTVNFRLFWVFFLIFLAKISVKRSIAKKTVREQPVNKPIFRVSIAFISLSTEVNLIWPESSNNFITPSTSTLRPNLEVKQQSLRHREEKWWRNVVKKLPLPYFIWFAFPVHDPFFTSLQWSSFYCKLLETS